MKQLIINFLRPFVIQIMKDHIKVTTKKDVVTKVAIMNDPPTGIPPIIPLK